MVGWRDRLFWDCSDLNVGKRPKTGTSGHLEANNRYTLAWSENHMTAAATKENLG